MGKRGSAILSRRSIYIKIPIGGTGGNGTGRWVDNGAREKWKLMQNPLFFLFALALCVFVETEETERVRSVLLKGDSIDLDTYGCTPEHVAYSKQPESATSRHEWEAMLL